jgi:hypothetical protein
LSLQQDAVDGQYVVQSFKWITQHLRVKAFYGTSENAVKTQIWIAVSVYLMVAIARNTLGVEASLYTFCRSSGSPPSKKYPFYRCLSALTHRTSQHPTLTN